MKRLLPLLAFFLLGISAIAQDTPTETPAKAVRKGWALSPLPCLAFDQDAGVQYGALANLYYFGSGDIYPEYYHSFYAQASYYSHGTGLFRLMYDSKHLIPGRRLTIDLSYMPEKESDFYGFNGHETYFHSEWVDRTSPQYRLWDYYKMRRNFFRFSADLQGNLSGNLNWNIGAGLLYYTIQRRDVDSPTLYDNFVQWGLIREEEKDGGLHPFVHGGFTYDSRNRLTNPSRGIHSDIFLTYNAALGDLKDYNHLKFNFNFRNFLPLWPEYITFAYQLGTQLTIAGKSPFYMSPYFNQIFLQRVVYEGLGGGNSMRGMLPNRLLSDGFVCANVELRVKLVSFQIKKELFYIGINPFLDYGQIVQRHDVEGVDLDALQLDANFAPAPSSGLPLWQRPHFTTGCGLKVVMNDNFALSVDCGVPLNSQDNNKSTNFYIKIGYMF